jgi:hypothetical protein
MHSDRKRRPAPSQSCRLWFVGRRALKLPVGLGRLPCRITIIRLADGALFLHSPIRLDAPIRMALEELGPIRVIVAPSKAHHLFVADYVKAYPDARLHGAPGLAEKTRGSEVRLDPW